MDLRRTAVHEAGHCVVGLGFDCPIDAATVVSTADASGRVRFSGDDRPAPVDVEGAFPLLAVVGGLRDIAIHLAGPGAELLAYGDASRSSDEDGATAAALAIAAALGAPPAWAGGLLGTTKAAVHTYLVNHVDAVERVAAVLLERGTVGGADVAAAVGPLPRPDLDGALRLARVVWSKYGAVRAQVAGVTA